MKYPSLSLSLSKKNYFSARYTLIDVLAHNFMTE